MTDHRFHGGLGFQVVGVVHIRHLLQRITVGMLVVAQDPAQARADFVAECLDAGEGMVRRDDIHVLHVQHRPDLEERAAVLTFVTLAQARRESAPWRKAGGPC